MNRLIINLLTVGTFLAGTAEYLIAGVVDRSLVTCKYL